MADDGYRKPFRSDDSFGRTTGASSLPSSASQPAASDPLAELARLIGQTDPFAEFGRTQRGASDMTAESVAPAPRALPSFDPPHYDPPAPPHHYEPSQFGLPFGAQPNSQPDYGQAPGHAPQLAGQGYHDGPGYDPAVFAQDHMQAGQDAYYDDVPPPRRRLSVLVIAGVFALAIVGTAGALGYRAMFGSSGSAPPPVIKAESAPSKVVPPAATAQSNKLINDRIGEKIQSERLVSREEQPVDLAKQTMQTTMTGGANAAVAPQAVVPSGAPALYAPKKVKTIAIRPDQPPNGSDTTATAQQPAPQPPTQAQPARTASAPMPLAAQDDNRPQSRPAAPAPHRSAATNPPLSLTPGANAAPAAPAAPVRAAPPPRVASAPASNGNGGYAVQISSQRSEADAQAAFRNMQGRYPSQLGGKQVMIRRADLGSKGVYYRAMVGPFASASDASELCNSLKAAGGQCIVQKI
ncbi:MAG: SPOR domain-containing protein [Xanthobacteraceae bacterium]|uniref:SPOR domain-containing protein n=1 Tax=Pseudolabrys sp. TaxID=1960880 RepID=UPI003D126B36